MLEKTEYSLNLRRSIALMLVAAMVYMLIFGGIDLSLFKWGKDQIEHIAIIEQGDGYTIYENSDGSNTLELTMETTKEESLVSIEDEIYDYKSADESSDIYFNPDFEAGEPSVKIDRAGMKIEMSPVIKTTAAVSRSEGYNQEENTYEKVYSEDTFGDGIDLEYTPITGGVKENIILNERTDINEFSYILNVENLTAEFVANNIILYNDEGEEEYTISAPIMYDNNGEESSDIQITLEETADDSQYKITIIPDKEWLNDSAREYPIVIDPNIIRSSGASLINDTYVSSQSDEKNKNYHTSDRLYVGLDYSDDIYRSYIDFDMPSTIPSHIIVTDAVVKIGRSNNLVADCFAALYEPSSTWDESTITWNNQPGVSGKYSSYNTRIKGAKTYEFDATKYAMDIFPNGEYVGDEANKGVVLKASKETTYTGYMQKRMSSSEGGTVKLVITYNVPIEMDAPTATVYGNGENSHDGYVELSWDAVDDADGYYVGIFNGDEYQVVDVDNVTSWSTQDQKIWPTEAQTDAGEYELRVDNYGNSLDDGDELYIFPNMAYRNAPDGTVDYDDDTNYYFIIIPHNSSGYMTYPALCDKAAVKIPDTIEPSAPTSVTVDPSDWSNQSSRTVTVTGIEDYNGNTFVNTGFTECKYYIGTDPSGTDISLWQDGTMTESPAETFTFTASIDSSVADGENIPIYVRIVDDEGNISDYNYGLFNLDTQAPTSPAITWNNDTWFSADNVAINWSGISELHGIDHVEYQIDTNPWVEITGTTDAYSGSYNLNISTLSEGVHTLNLRAVDAAGNDGAETQININIDRTVPVIGSLTNDALIWMNTDYVQFTYSGVEDTMSGLETLEYSQDTVNWTNLDLSATGWTIDFSSINFGEYEYTLKAADKAGNEATATTTARIDKVNPTTDITSPLDNANVNAIVEIQGTVYDGTVSADTLSEYTLIANRYTSDDVFIETINISAGSDRIENNIIGVLDVSGYSHGDKVEFVLTAKDIAGNESTESGQVEVNKDVQLINNILTITSPVSGGKADEQNEQIVFEREASASGTLNKVNLFVDGEFVSESLTSQVYLDTLLYEENDNLIISIIGENDGGELEYSQGLSESIVFSSTIDQQDFSEHTNVEFTSNGLTLSAGETQGSAVFNEITFDDYDLTYEIGLTSIHLSGTDVKIEVSFDDGVTWIERESNVAYILEDGKTALVRLTLTGDGTNTPTVKAIQVNTAGVQNPYSIKVKTVEPVENLQEKGNTSGKITISWDDCGDSAVKYDIYRSTENNFTISDSNKVVSSLSGTLYADINVKEGVTYYYKVVATKTFNVSSPYIAERRSEERQISVTAYKTPTTSYDEDTDVIGGGDEQEDDYDWGNPEEIDAAKSANDLYGGNWTVNNELEPPEGASEMNESMLGARTFCAAGFEPVNFVSGNFFMKQADAAYTALPDVNSSILRTYNTQSDEDNGPLGDGWSWYYSMHLKLYSTGDVGMIQSDGHLAMFRIQSDGTYLSDEDELMILTKTTDEYIVTNQEGEQIVFDSGGQLKRVVSENGNTSEVKYDDRGVIDKVVYSTGKVMDITTDTNGHITVIEMPDGRKVYYEYEDNNLVKYYDVAGDATTYEYDENGRMAAWYDKNGARQVYNVYDDEDRVVEQWDANGYYYQIEYRENSVFTTDGEGDTQEYYFDEMGRTIKIVDSEGYSQEYRYNTNSQVVEYTDKLGMVTKYEYDGNDNLVKEITNDNRVRYYTYDENNNLTGETDYLGNWTVYEYDDNNNLIKRTYSDGSSYSYEYNEDNQLVKLTDPNGSSELYEYDGEVLGRYTDAEGNVTEYEYNERDELVKIRDAKNNITKLEYNASGDIVKTILPDNTSMSYEYDAMDNMISFTDAKGQVTEFEYDALGNMVKTINPDGTEISYEYDGNSNLIKTIYADGTYVVNTYNSNGDLISTADQDGRTYVMEYNPVGDILGITEPNSTVSELEYSTETGWLEKTVDGSDAETEYEYDDNGNVIKMTYTDGTTTEFAYDSMNRIKTQTLNNGAVTTYNYDALGQLESVIVPLGNATWYIYDKIGQLVQVIDSLGNRTNFEYDAIGNMTSMTDANGETITYAYDAASQLEKIIAPLGGSVEYNYDPNGQLEKVINALGGTADNVYDEMGRVIESTDLLGATTTYEYDIVGNMVKETNALGNSFSYEYDANGNIIKITDSLQNEAEFEYDVMSNITKIEGEEGYEQEYEYDSLSRVVKSKDSEGYEVYYEYDDMGYLVKESDNTDKEISYTYTSIGQVKTMTNAEGETTELFYDLNGNTTKVLYADGTTETYYYNELNQLVRQYDRSGLETEYTYDAVGNVIEVRQPSNQVYKYEYDANGNLVKEINPEGGETTYKYDKAGNAISVTDPLGSTTEIEYNDASMIEKVIDASGTTTLIVDYSILGEVVSETDALNNVTQYSYDASSRLISVTDPLGRVTEYEYDGADNIVSVIDGNDNVTAYEYNTMGLLIKETDALGNVEEYEYYVDGLLEQITKADGTASNYEYDLAGRMTGVEYSDGTTIDYGYNEIGSVTTMVDSTGTTTYQYDDMQRLVSTTDSNDKTVSYTYDILGRETSITTPDGTTTNYEYDVMDRLVEVTQDGEIAAEYEYDANSQLISNTRNDITTTYEYDELGQLTELTTSDINEKIQQFSYQYDELGNIVEEVREEDATSVREYTYDAANQLTEFTDNDYTESYTYDDVGNMLTKSVNDEVTSYTYNEGNQLISELVSDTQIDYTYNQNGDLGEKSTGEQYTYDIQGNLTSIQGNGIDQSFEYNGNGNRLSKTVDGETTYFVNDLNQSYEQVLQTYDEDGNVINTYTYGVQRIQSVGETTETYLYDGRGSVVGTVDNNDILTSYSYTAYGELMPESPTPNVFGYNGEATDYQTGLQYLRARYYDTGIQRFVQEDDYRGDFTRPSSMNRYAYAHNNPVMGIDPSGYARTSAMLIDGEYRVDPYVGTYTPSAKTVHDENYGYCDDSLLSDEEMEALLPWLEMMDSDFLEALKELQGDGESEFDLASLQGVSDIWYSPYGREMICEAGRIIADGFKEAVDSKMEYENREMEGFADAGNLIKEAIAWLVDQAYIIEMQKSGKALLVSNYYSTHIETAITDYEYRSGDLSEEEHLRGIVEDLGDFRDTKEYISDTYMFMGESDPIDVVIYSKSGGFNVAEKGSFGFSAGVGQTIVVNFAEEWAAKYTDIAVDASYGWGLPLNYSRMIGTATGDKTDDPTNFEGVTLQLSESAVLQASTGFIPGTDIEISGLGISTNIGVSFGGTYSDITYILEDINEE